MNPLYDAQTFQAYALLLQREPGRAPLRRDRPAPRGLAPRLRALVQTRPG